MKRGLSPSQAYRLGFRRARQRMRKELDELACRLHNEVSEIAVEATSRLRTEIVRLVDEVKAARDERRSQSRDAEQLHRLRNQLDAATGELVRDRYLRALTEAENERAMIEDKWLN